MSRLSEALAAVFENHLKRAESRVKKAVSEEGAELLEKTKVAKPGKARTKTPVSAPLGAKPTLLGPKTRTVTREEFEAILEEDIDRAVSKGRKALAPPAAPPTGKPGDVLKRAAGVNPANIWILARLGLTRGQTATIDKLLGRFFGQPHKLLSTEPRLLRAEKSANRILKKLEDHWESALPPGKSSRLEVLEEVWDKLQANKKKAKAAARKAGKEVPANFDDEFVRGVLFDTWKDRWKRRLETDPELASLLKSSTGMKFKVPKGGKTSRLALDLEVGEKETMTLYFDVDHGDEGGLATAVRTAKRPADLRPVVDSNYLQLLPALENQQELRRLRNHFDDFSAKAAEAAKTRATKVDVKELRRDLDEMLEVLDRPGRTLKDLEEPVTIPTGEDWISGH